LAVSAELPEDTVYDITKALFENAEELAKSHAKGKDVIAEQAVNGVSVEFHPGAKKYYQEKGLLK